MFPKTYVENSLPVPHYALLDYPFMFPLGIPNLVRSHGRWLIDGLCLVLHDKLELLMLQLQPGRVHRGQKYIDGNDDTLSLKLTEMMTPFH
uniref:Uncharacterized protein n=1 Tax=Triticum urartu TaxID=4572 RepID=A0A8R7V216_TRIUA